MPDPDAPPVIEIHVALSLVVHAHPAGAVTAIVFVDAAGPSDATVGEIAYVHGAPACVVIVCPAIVIVPVRLLVSALAATLPTRCRSRCRSHRP